MLHCIIIDDEQHCIDTLTAMLRARFAQRVSVLASTIDSRKAAALIAQHSPDLVFMDVEMPHLNGIQLLQSLAPRSFAVIFTTAWDKYALDALKTEAVDYLLKPISLSELSEAIEKAAARRSPGPARGALHQKLLLPTGNGILAASISDIIRVEASSNYCTVHISGKAKVVVAKTLKEYEEILLPSGFFRVHQSHLVNLAYVEYLHAEDYVILSTGEQVEVSRRRKAEFLQRLAGM